MASFVAIRTIRHFNSNDLEKKIQTAVLKAIDSFKPDIPYTLQTPIKDIFKSIEAVRNLLLTIRKRLKIDYMIDLDVDKIDARRVYNQRTVSGLKIDVKAAVKA